nr:hypothetical protein [Tanacetum cinerariifolium]
MNSSLMAPSLEFRCLSTKAFTCTDAKFRSVDRGFVASVVGGGVGVDWCGGGEKDGVLNKSSETSFRSTLEFMVKTLMRKSLSKKKEKIIVKKCKGIDLLSKVALTKEAQYEEVRKKSLRDFHKTYLSGSCTITKTTPSAAKIKHSVTDEGTGVKPGVPSVTEKESTKSEAKY